MKRLLTAGIFGTILGIVGAGTANASIVSSGFLDEKLTEYALSTSLDLKANQNDLTALSNKIGDLPTEIVIGNSNGSINMFNITKSQRVSLPKDYTLSDFIQDMYYGSFGVNAGLGTSPFYGLSDIIDHVMYGGIIGEAGGGLAGKEYKGLIDLTLEINKIGDLPTEIPNMVSTWTKYGFVENPGTPIDLPDTIGGMFAMLFNEDTSYNGLSLGNIMGKILMGFDAIGSRIEGLSSLTSVYNLRGDSPIVTAVKVNTAKIGTLPAGYDSVGAALTAIKGIAEDAKAAALAAIPDPKQEGSSGKFVLTVDIVGDNATYHWEKIDREGETTTTE